MSELLMGETFLSNLFSLWFSSQTAVDEKWACPFFIDALQEKDPLLSYLSLLQSLMT